MAKVSVVVPMFHGETTVAASLESLLTQTLQDLEVIVVDDGSTDRGPSIVEQISKRDSRVKLLVQPNNSGTHQTRVAGIHAASSRWIGFLDADDFARPSMYEKLLRRAEDEVADVAICGIDLVNEQRAIAATKARFADAVWNEKEAFGKFCRGDFGTASLCNKLYRSELIREYGTRAFRWRQDIGEDTIVNTGCFRNARRVVTLKEQLHCYTINTQSVTATSGKPKAFAGMIRSYAESMLQYGKDDSKAAAEITLLYARLLNMECYHVKAAEDLVPFQQNLAGPLEFLAQQYPTELTLLLNRGFMPPSPRRSVPVRAIRKLKRMVGL